MYVMYATKACLARNCTQWNQAGVNHPILFCLQVCKDRFADVMQESPGKAMILDQQHK